VQSMLIAATILAGPIIPLQNFKALSLPPWIF